MAKLKLIDTKDKLLNSVCYKLSDNTLGRRGCTAQAGAQRC